MILAIILLFFKQSKHANISFWLHCFHINRLFSYQRNNSSLIAMKSDSKHNILLSNSNGSSWNWKLDTNNLSFSTSHEFTGNSDIGISCIDINDNHTKLFICDKNSKIKQYNII